MKPLIRNTEEVRSILRGKSQFREIIRLPDIKKEIGDYELSVEKRDVPKGFQIFFNEGFYDGDEKICDRWIYYGDIGPKYSVGDILYVREAWARASRDVVKEKYLYRADYEGNMLHYTKGEWHSPVTMPREAARLFLKITDVRAERVRDISEEDAIKEGTIWEHPFANPEDCTENTRKYHWIECFKEQWLSKHPHTWDKWVWVYTFEQVK